MNEFPLVEVVWLDACSEEAHIELEVAMLVEPLIRRNAGYCIINNKKEVVLAFGIIENMFKGKNACNVTMAIPKGCIKSITRL